MLPQSTDIKKSRCHLLVALFFVDSQTITLGKDSVMISGISVALYPKGDLVLRR